MVNWIEKLKNASVVLIKEAFHGKFVLITAVGEIVP